MRALARTDTDTRIPRRAADEACKGAGSTQAARRVRHVCDMHYVHYVRNMRDVCDVCDMRDMRDRHTMHHAHAHAHPLCAV
jgi:hypothetical protein